MLTVRRACLDPTCPALVEPPASRCPRHQREHERARAAVRGTAAARGYDSAWRRARSDYLASHPWCEPCLAAGRPGVRATLVDHHVPLRSQGPRLDPRNFAAMCRSCHSRKTWRDGSRRARR